MASHFQGQDVHDPRSWRARIGNGPSDSGNRFAALLPGTMMPGLLNQDQSQPVRRPTRQEYVHEALGDIFERALSTYDTRRRVETLVDDFLPDSFVKGKSVLDVGCGLGFFSERLRQRGAHVTACDIG